MTELFAVESNYDSGMCRWTLSTDDIVLAYIGARDSISVADVEGYLGSALKGWPPAHLFLNGATEALSMRLFL